MRRCISLALVMLVASAAVAARERSPAHPSDETEVFSGGEDEARGEAVRPPPIAYWRVRASVTVPPAAGDVAVRLFVPLSDGRQDVVVRRAAPVGLRFREEPEPPNLRAEWTGPAPDGVRLEYDVAVRIEATAATVPAVPVARLAPPDDPATRLPGPRMQSAAPEVVRAARQVLGGTTRLDRVVWSLYQFTAAFLPADGPAGPQDAVSVIGARRGTSLGRARALVALLRAAGVPARLVGGLRLAAGERRATISWAEAWVGTGWVPLDPSAGFYASLPNTYLALYRGDLPLLVHTRGLDVDYGFRVRTATRRAVEEGEEEPDADVTPAGPPRTALAGPAGADVETHAAYVTTPVASVVIIADQSVPSAVTDRILDQAHEAAIDCVLLTARFESRYFRQRYLAALVAANLPLLRRANLVLVATADDAGTYALMELGARNVRMPDARIVAAGAMSDAAARLLGALLHRLVRPGEVVMVPRRIDLLPLWEMARANLIDGTPMEEEARRWDVRALVFGETAPPLPRWRRPLVDAWSRVVRAGVPLGALTLVLVLPVIATVVVVARLVVGIETFGVFGPVIVALAFVTTGLWWGTLIFFAVVGLGVALRIALQRLRLQAVARLAILITLVAAVMGGLTLVGAFLGVGPLLHVSIFPMIIMSNVIENFAASQVELGTRRALGITLGTLALAIVCYLVVEASGLQSLLLAHPEILLATVAADVALGKWRGLRLLEYRRFRHVAAEPPGAAPAAEEGGATAATASRGERP